MKIIDWLKRKYWKWQVKKGIIVLESLDKMMIKAGYVRYERRRFWGEFVKKYSNRFRIIEKLKEENK